MPIDVAAFREQSRRDWGDAASGWASRRDWLSGSSSMNQWIADRVDPKPSQVVLDVAAGPGDLGHMIAPRVSPGGRVLITDFAPEMVELARRLGTDQRIDGVEYHTLDAERMDLSDASVDAVVCRWGFMLMGDPAAALSESRRVLKPGGQLAFAVFSTPDRNPWAAAPAMTLVARGHLPSPEPGAPGVFAMADPDRIRDLVTGAGFAEPEITSIPHEFRYADDDDLWGAIVGLNGTVARTIISLSAEERDATRSAVLESVGAYLNADGSYSIPAFNWGIVAR